MKRSGKIVTAKNYHRASIEEVRWQDIAKQVKKVAPDIYDAINQLEIDSSCKLYKVRYPYGAMIIGQEGIFNLPNKYGELVPITDISISKNLQTDLNYNWNAIPMGLIMDGHVELFLEDQKDYIEPHGIYREGILALRAVLDQHCSPQDRSYHAKRFFRMTSGSRYVYSLASIFDAASFKRLKNYFHLSIDKSQVKHDVWGLFRELANSEEFKTEWYTEILFFSKKWLHHPKNEAWKSFRLALFEMSWKASEYERNRKLLSRIWNIHKSNKKISDYVFQMIQYIAEAALGRAALYKPIDASNMAGPFTDCVDVLMNVYGLKKYVPIIVHTGYYDHHQPQAGYLSVQKPCVLVTEKKVSSRDNLIVEVREIRKAMLEFIKEIKEGVLRVEDTPFYHLQEINFDFYHSDMDIYNEFYPSREIFSGDKRVEDLLDACSNKEIPFRNDLLRSCIKIYKK